LRPPFFWGAGALAEADAWGIDGKPDNAPTLLMPILSVEALNQM
jgi:hypothetical protein